MRNGEGSDACVLASSAPLLFPQSFRFRWMVRLALGAGMVLVAGRPSAEIFFAGVLYGEMVTESPNRGHREKDGRIIDGGHAL